MLQRILQLPFSLTDTHALYKEWNRLESNLITFSECPNALKAEFNCKAEIIFEAPHNDDDISKALIPSGEGKLYLTAQYIHHFYLYYHYTLPLILFNLFIIRKLYWISSTGTTGGWSVEYPDILLHAVLKSSDTPNPTRTSLYLHLNANKILNENGEEIEDKDKSAENMNKNGGNDPESTSESDNEQESEADDNKEDNENEEEDFHKFIEVKLYPESELLIEEMFLSLSECSALHPSTTNSDDEEGSNEEDSEGPNKKHARIDFDGFTGFEDSVEH